MTRQSLLRGRALLPVWALVFASAPWPACGSLFAADDVLARCRATYAALRSYADTGTVVTELGLSGAPTLKETHTFTTYYRGPRYYYFEFNKDKTAGGDRFVIWGDETALHTWWKTTGVDETYPPGKGAGAFAQAEYVTKGSASQIAPLLFSKAGLQGTLANLVDATVEGTEEVGGRRCHRLTGVSRDLYPATGREVRVRRTTIWIDAETLLVRSVLEDTPRDTPAGTILRVTTTFEPQANPTIEDARFRFAVPNSRK